MTYSVGCVVVSFSLMAVHHHLHPSDPDLNDKIVAIGKTSDAVVIEVEIGQQSGVSILSDLYSVLLHGAGPLTNACICLRSNYSQDKVHGVVLGGTFDHLHVGHKLLLACALYYVQGQTPAKIVIGLTTDQYLASKNKQWSNYIESYQQRKDRLVSFIRSIDVRVEIQVEPLHDCYGPALNADLDAIVVSEETAAGAEEVNRRRLELGLPKLRVIETKAIGLSGMDKVSSTWIREQLHRRQDKSEA